MPVGVRLHLQRPADSCGAAWGAEGSPGRPLHVGRSCSPCAWGVGQSQGGVSPTPPVPRFRTATGHGGGPTP